MKIAWKVRSNLQRISDLPNRKAPLSFARKKSQRCSRARFWLSIAVGIVLWPVGLRAGQENDIQLSSSSEVTKLSPLAWDYIYAYAPVTMAATRAIQTAVPDNTKPGQAPINQFSHQTKLSTANDRLVVRPNADTLYSDAWLDLAQEPLILHVPNVAGRYYLIPMLDAYSNVFASIGLRTTGTGEGNYAIVGPFWQGPVPENVTGVIYAPTNTVWADGRTLVNGPSDLQNALSVISQYLLIPLSAYPQFLQTGTYTPPTGVPVTPPIPDFFGFPVTKSQGFSEPKFFDVLAKYALKNPPSQDFLRASGFVLDGFSDQNQLDSDVISEATAAMNIALPLTAINENGWSFHLNIGNYGTHYLVRAAVAQFGFGTNIPADAVYTSTEKDISGVLLTGTNSYVIHFAPGQTPPEMGFWSVTVYGKNGFFLENSIHRYDVGSQTGLVTNPDGSLDIFLQNTQPQTMQSNWLPIPAVQADDPTDSFNLTLRIYGPDQSVQEGTWTPPTLSRTNAPLP
jgi:hypothetical protein